MTQEFDCWPIHIFDDVIDFLTFGIIGAVIVYDITDLDSFQRMKEWMKELRT